MENNLGGASPGEPREQTLTPSLSISEWEPEEINGGPAEDFRSPVRYGLDPRVLLASGILRNPAIPKEALKRSQSLCRQDSFKEARKTLAPHNDLGDPASNALRLALLARCAFHGVGAEPGKALDRALGAFRELGDDAAAARLRILRGEYLIGRGELEHAERDLKRSIRDLERMDDPLRAARARGLLARICLLRGDANEALSMSADALARCGSHAGYGAMVHLERARIHAYRNAETEVARDLVEAERALRSRTNLTDRLRPRIARAESLVIMGDRNRALRGLRRLLVDVVTIEDARMRADVHLLLGLAALDSDPTVARRFLLRARHLHDGVDATYGQIRTDIALARVEHRLALHVGPRMEALTRWDISELPLLQFELTVARAEIFGASRPAVARRALLVARDVAAEGGLRAFMGEATRSLKFGDLLADDELAELTPVERRRAGMRRETLDEGPAPQPMNDGKPSIAVNLSPSPTRADAGISMRSGAERIRRAPRRAVTSPRPDAARAPKRQASDTGTSSDSAPRPKSG